LPLEEIWLMGLLLFSAATSVLGLIPEAAESVGALAIGALLLLGFFLGMAIEIFLSSLHNHERNDIEMSLDSAPHDYFASFGSIRYGPKQERVEPVAENSSLAWNNVCPTDSYTFNPF
jgi:hypothetical protein